MQMHMHTIFEFSGMHMYTTFEFSVSTEPFVTIALKAEVPELLHDTSTLQVA